MPLFKPLETEDTSKYQFEESKFQSIFQSEKPLKSHFGILIPSIYIQVFKYLSLD